VGIVESAATPERAQTHLPTSFPTRFPKAGQPFPS
jgi:hypothetical protein